MSAVTAVRRGAVSSLVFPGRSGQTSLATIGGVGVVHWDPLRRSNRWGAPRRISRPVGNFGDLLGPAIVDGVVRQLSLPASTAVDQRRLVAIGSTLHFAEPGDTIWGTGLNPKGEPDAETLARLDVRAVRGPRTAEALRSRFDVAVPAVYGDPALLLPIVHPHTSEWTLTKRHPITIIPNLNELEPRSQQDRRYRGATVTPRAPLWRVIRRIAESDFVVGSSLHAVIVAESLGVPVRAVVATHEDPFKYEDYFLGTGRDPAGMIAASVDEALLMGPGEQLLFDSGPLLRSFPRDLWER